MAYATREDVLPIIQVMRPDFELTHISQQWLDMSEMRINAYLEEAGIDTPATDRSNLLKHSTICFYLEYASNTGQIQSHFGDVKKRQLKGMVTEYDAKAPMFFFATGGAKAFYDLLAHETWRMQGYQLLKGWRKAHYRALTGKKFHYATYATDTTDRGYTPPTYTSSWNNGDW